MTYEDCIKKSIDTEISDRNLHKKPVVSDVAIAVIILLQDGESEARPYN